MKFDRYGIAVEHIWSLPARGVWIEISKNVVQYLGIAVTPRKGSVD